MNSARPNNDNRNWPALSLSSPTEILENDDKDKFMIKVC